MDEEEQERVEREISPLLRSPRPRITSPHYSPEGIKSPGSIKAEASNYNPFSGSPWQRRRDSREVDSREVDSREVDSREADSRNAEGR